MTINQDEVTGIINICSWRPEKLSDRVERFIKENNYNIKLEYGAFPDRPCDSKAVWGNNKKIQKIFVGSTLIQWTLMHLAFVIRWIFEEKSWNSVYWN